MEMSIIKQFADVFNIQGAWVLVTFLFLYTYKKAKEVYSYHKLKRSEALQRLIDFYNTTSEVKDPILLESLFEDYFGKTVSSHELHFFRNTSWPSRYIRMYLSARSYLEIPSHEDKLVVRKDKCLAARRFFYLGWYFVFGFLGIAMLFGAYPVFSEIGPKIYIPWVLTNFSLLTLAYIGLDTSASVMTAESLVKEINNQ